MENRLTSPLATRHWATLVALAAILVITLLWWGLALWPLPTDADGINEACRRLHEHESFDELLTQVGQAHARLMGAARNAPDLDTPCFRRANGELLTGRQRLEALARHWAEHVRELQAAG